MEGIWFQATRASPAKTNEMFSTPLRGVVGLYGRCLAETGIRARMYVA
jgi:hypothetical protein